MPVTLLLGGAVALLCNLISVLPGETGILPLNAITPVLGAPVIIYILVNSVKFNISIDYGDFTCNCSPSIGYRLLSW